MCISEPKCDVRAVMKRRRVGVEAAAHGGSLEAVESHGRNVPERNAAAIKWML